MKKKKTKIFSRYRRLLKSRKKMISLGNTRLVIHRTSRHMYAQIVSCDSGNVLVYASTLEKKIMIKGCYTGNKNSAGRVGLIIAERALKKGISKVSFDRSGFKYHGRVKELADFARSKGLIF